MNMNRWMTVALTLLLAACQGPSADRHDADAQSMALHIYDVPAAQTDGLRDALGKVLAGDKAHVSAPTPGKLLVYAPSSAQDSIGQALATLAKAAPSAPETTVQARFWVINASAGSGPDDPQLASLNAALTPLRKSLGPMQFQLDQAVAGALVYGKYINLAGIDGKIFGLTALAAPQGALDLDVQYQDTGNESGIRSLNTHVATRLGETIVLAQAPRGCRLPMGGSCTTKGMQLLVVRVDPLTVAQ